MSAVTLDARTGETEPFSCPWCGKPMLLWRERFKGSHTTHVRSRHVHNVSDNCNAPAVAATEVHPPAPKANEGEWDGECG